MTGELTNIVCRLAENGIAGGCCSWTRSFYTTSIQGPVALPPVYDKFSFAQFRSTRSRSLIAVKSSTEKSSSKRKEYLDIPSLREPRAESFPVVIFESTRVQLLLSRETRSLTPFLSSLKSAGIDIAAPHTMPILISKMLSFF